jgi:hypothetical protein
MTFKLILRCGDMSCSLKTGGSATELSVTDAWADAAAGDVNTSHIPGDAVCTVADQSAN